MRDERQSLSRGARRPPLEVSTTRIDAVWGPGGRARRYVHLVLSLGRKHPGQNAQGSDDEEADQDAPPAVFTIVRQPCSEASRRKLGEGGEGKRRGLRRTRWPCWVLLGLVDLVMQAKGGETVSSGRNLCEVVMMRRFRGSLAGRTRSSFGRRYFVQANVRKLGSWNAEALANKLAQ